MRSADFSMAIAFSPPAGSKSEETPIPGTERSTMRTGLAPYKMLDAWRGFASLWVVMFHITEILVQRTPALSTNPIYWFGLQGGLGVQLFFVISGYCILSAAGSACRASLRGSVTGSGPLADPVLGTTTRFMWARLRRIFPPFWYALLLTALTSLLALWLVARGVLHESVAASKVSSSIFYYLANLTLSQVGVGQPCLLGPSWSLCYELAFYFIIALMLGGSIYWHRSRGTGSTDLETSLLWMSHLLTVAVLCLLIAKPNKIAYPFDLWFSFGLGALVYDVARRQIALAQPRIELRSIYLLLLLLTVGIVVFWIRYPYAVGYLGNGGRLPFLVADLFVFILIVGRPYDERVTSWPPVRALGRIGEFSYSLYLTHVVVIGLATQVLRRLHLPGSGNLLVLVLVMGVSVLFARGFYQVCERPFLKTRREEGKEGKKGKKEKKNRDKN